MTQKTEVLAREASHISLVSARGATRKEDYLTITERQIPVDTIEQAWIFEVGEEARVGRTTPRLVNTLAKITRWLNRLGSGKVDESYLESRHDIHHNFRGKGIGL